MLKFNYAAILAATSLLATPYLTETSFLSPPLIEMTLLFENMS